MRTPNVVLMFVDDLGYGDVSCFNKDSKISTPFIDALAKRGMCFTDSHATSALCTPSRYGLLTGRYNWRSLLKSNVLPGSSDPLIEKGRMTLADLFKKRGYKTACVGKWHLGLEWERKESLSEDEYGGEAKKYPINPNCFGRNGNFEFSTDFLAADGLDIDFDKPIRFGPCNYGFDYFYGLPASLDQPPYVYIENDKVVTKPNALSGVERLDRTNASQPSLWQKGPIAPDYDHTKVLPDMTNKVLELIAKFGNDPFFIYFPTPAVHGPLLPTKEFLGKSGIGNYGDVVLMVDDMVKSITESLEKNGILDDTIFIFTSDNGCSGIVDFPALIKQGHNPSYIFRGKKSEIYEGGHRVPTIVSYPRKIDGGKVCNHTVCHCDFFRTFADLLSQELPDNAAEDSVSNLPLWEGSDACVREYTVYSSNDGSFSIKRGEWKLELCRGSGGMDKTKLIDPSTSDEHPYQLYKITDDIVEQTNVASQHPQLVEELKNLLLECIQNGRSTKGALQENSGKSSWKQVELIKKNQ